MEELNTAEARQRVERWAEEGQYLLSRVVPTLLEQQERLLARAEASEQSAEKLRHGLHEIERELQALRAENETYRKEQAELREVFGALVQQANHMLKPLNDVLQKLQA
jgi:hypothetical protein